MAVCTLGFERRGAALLLGLLAAFCAGAMGCDGGKALSDAPTAVTSDERYTLIEPGVLTVATTLSDFPYESLQSGYQPTGFACELLQEVGSEMGLEVRFDRHVEKDASLEALGGTPEADEPTADAALDCLKAGALNVAGFAVSQPYVEVSQCVVVRKKDSEDFAQAMMGRMGVVRESDGARWAREQCARAQLVDFSTAEEALSALQSDNLEACVVDALELVVACDWGTATWP